VQFWHCPPPAPQALSKLPCWQKPPWQQPKEQVCALHGWVHVWFWHVSPKGRQFWHC
jgi:hypothetical protein